MGKKKQSFIVVVNFFEDRFLFIFLSQTCLKKIPLWHRTTRMALAKFHLGEKKLYELSRFNG